MVLDRFLENHALNSVVAVQGNHEYVMSLRMWEGAWTPPAPWIG